MSIKNVARDLYRLQKEVERLEKELENCPPDKRQHLEEELIEARQERDKIKELLEGAKQTPTYRRPL